MSYGLGLVTTLEFSYYRHTGFFHAIVLGPEGTLKQIWNSLSLLEIMAPIFQFKRSNSL